MSEINNDLNRVDQEMNERKREEKETHIIQEAMQKRPESGKSSRDILGLKKLKTGNFSLVIYTVCLVLAVAFAVVFLYASTANNKMDGVQNTFTEFEALMDEQAEATAKLEEHITAVEAEFRRALKKDREETAAFQERMVKEMEYSQQLLQKFKDDTKMQVANYKSQVADNQAVVGRIEREYQGMADEFTVIQEELKGLRARVMKMSAPGK